MNKSKDKIKGPGKNHWLTISGGISFLIALFWATGGISAPVQAQQSGITPGNYDGFETGDWRNFRPRYVGDSDDFIRPRFDVRDEQPISGTYSLRWAGGEEKHEWLMLSNAFYFAKPMQISVNFRVDQESDLWSAGLYLMQDYDFFSGIRVQSNGIQMQVDASEWGNEPESDIKIIPGNVYQMQLELDERNRFKASILDSESGELIFEKSGISAINPVSLAIYVHTEAGSTDLLHFDDVRVNSAEYRVKSGTWTRAPIPNYVVLPRYPDVTQEEGNWVGGHSVMKTEDGRYLMWYRIRDNRQRGAGYGFAQSEDGLNWEKYENNPVFVADEQYASNEKISVLKIDGMYRAWYTVEDGGRWITLHTESEDGIHWKNHEHVIDDVLAKDAEVIYLDGKYYLYAIGPTYTDIAVYTSENGISWTYENEFNFGVHRHLAAYFEEKNSEFWLYPSAGGQGVSEAVSSDGVEFSSFLQTWSPPAVGLDDWHEAGITYLSFLRNEHGHIQNKKTLPVYYQARNTYENNIPGWLYHGGERVVLAGKFEGLYLDIPTWVKPDGSYQYEAFPFEVEKAQGLRIYTQEIARVEVAEWNPENQTMASGFIEPSSTTMVQWELRDTLPNTEFEVRINDGEILESGISDEDGYLLIRTVLNESDKYSFSLYQK